MLNFIDKLFWNLLRLDRVSDENWNVRLINGLSIVTSVPVLKNFKQKKFNPKKMRYPNYVINASALYEMVFFDNSAEEMVRNKENKNCNKNREFV